MSQQPIFSFDLRRARKGDCFLLHYGTGKEPGLVLVDGGPSRVYGPHLVPRLDEIRAARRLESQEPLVIDLLMVSHVDDDHIAGIIELTRDEIQRVAARRPRQFNVLDFWHNSFDAVVGRTPEDLRHAFGKGDIEAALGNGGLNDALVDAIEDEAEEGPEVIRASLAVLASVAQGFRLRSDADGLGFPLNTHFDGGLIIADPEVNVCEFGNGLTLTVVGPAPLEVKRLHEEHQAWLEELEEQGKSPASALAAYVDKSVPNLASLVVVAEVNGKRMLLTGDARGDKILEGLESAGMLDSDGGIDLDLLKVPHHGSSNNLTDDFFERVRATHYVLSGDGEHGNPERESLEWLFAARAGEAFAVHLTYPPAESDVERRKDWEKERRKEQTRAANATANGKAPKPVRKQWSDADHGLEAFIAGLPATERRKIQVVPETGAHVIDLLEPLGY